jgi:hypothetical protein
LAGTAVTEAEAKRIQAFVPNPGTGLLDGDGPQEMASKVAQYHQFARLAVARLQWARKHGITDFEEITRTSLESMPQIMAEEIANQAQAIMQQSPGITEDAAIEQATKIIGQQFGML